MIHLCKSTGLNSFELALIYLSLDNGVMKSPKSRNIVSLVLLVCELMIREFYRSV